MPTPRRFGALKLKLAAEATRLEEAAAGAGGSLPRFDLEEIEKRVREAGPGAPLHHCRG